MQLTFLQGQEPYTKKYTKRPDGSYKGSSYPNVFLVTSHVEEIDDLAGFASALETHSAAGHCLLTNNLDKKLENESRAKHQKKDEPREWVVLDIDGLEGVATAEQFILSYLPEPFHRVSYVVQYSPSQGIKPGLRCHIYFLLYDPISAAQVTTWLTWHNLDHQVLSNSVTLSKSNMALSYPLDKVASSNGRIVYIAPPECEGFSDPVAERISVVEKDYERLSFGFVAPSPAEVRARARDLVNSLREARGLAKKNAKEHIEVRPDGTEVLKKDLIEQGKITSWEEDNKRFMRCNINYGDSFAYYYHRDQEHPLLHNFKGEPSMLLERFDPEYYREHVVPHFEELQKSMPRPFVFRDVNTDKYMVGMRKDTEIVEQPKVVGAKDRVEDFFTFHNTSPPFVIPPWNMVFDPTFFEQWNEDDRVFNSWRPTEFQKHQLYTSSIPPICERIIRHVTGNDEETFTHFVNWLAFIQQKRTKPGTAWVLHGVPGTGKGLLFHHIMRPIFGEDYCVSKQLSDLADDKNGWMEQCLFVNIDEANAEDVGVNAKRLVNALKNWITEPTISVRHMQVTAQQKKSYMNFLFTTNDFGILPIQEGDRRINVAPRQETKLEITDEEVNEIDSELFQMSAFLTHYKVDEAMARRPLENTAKEALKAAARSSIDDFFHAASTGNLKFFLEGVTEDSDQHGEVARFKKAAEEWRQDAIAGRPSYIDAHELKAAHVVMCRDKGMKSLTFSSMAAKRGFPKRHLRLDNETCARLGFDEGARFRGWKIDWQLTHEQKVDLKMHLSVVPTQADLEEKIKGEIEGSPD